MFTRIAALLATVLMVASIAISGAKRGPQIQKSVTISGDEVFQARPENRTEVPPVPYNLGPGTLIDITSYDLATNASANRNLIDFGSTIAMVRMAAHDLTPATSDRDAWWDCWPDGGTPGPLTRVGAVRTGWANIADLGGRESIVSHTGLEVEVASSQCSGVWTTTSTGNTAHLWPRTATTGTTNLHIVHANANPPTNIVYSRSTNSGATFDKVGVSFAKLPFVANADVYDIASDGTNLAVVMTGIVGDIILLTSSDNGENWDQTTIYDVDETGFTEQDVPDGSIAAVYDNDGNVHVVWGSYYASGQGIDSVFYSVESGIHHWSAATGDQMIALPPSDAILPQNTGPNFAATRNGSIANQPDIGADADNNLCVVYQAWTSELDALGDPQEHIFGVASGDGGVTWGEIIDLTPGTGFSAANPSVADVIDDDLDIVYFCDEYSGSYIYDALVGGDHPQIYVDIIFLEVPKSEFFPFPQEVCDALSTGPLKMKCQANGTINIRKRMIGFIGFGGTEVKVLVDGTDSYTFTIEDAPNGAGSSIEGQMAGSYAPGDHTVSIPDCGIEQVVNCQAPDAMDLTEDSDLLGVPASTELMGNYPNPFNPSTTISYALSADTYVTLKIYNTLGQEVATLVDGFQTAGYLTATWNGRNDFGSTVSSGIYIYRLTAGDVVQTAKMMFMK